MTKASSKPPAAPLPGDCLVLAAQDLAGPAVERGGDGVPTAFRVLAPGALPVLQAGAPRTLNFTPADCAHVLSVAQAQQYPVCVDCDHASYLLSVSLGQQEGKLAATPFIGERLAVGRVGLEARDDGVWARVQDWTARGRALLAEKAYRYFSPVIRDHAAGKAWVSSIALTNQPATIGQEPLVLSAIPAGNPQQGGAAVNEKLLAVLRSILGNDALALDAQGQVPADLAGQIEARFDVLSAQAASGEKLRANLAPVLALSADAKPELIEGTVKALAEKAKGDAEALTAISKELAAVKEQAAAAAKAKLIDEGVAAGKITPALRAWAQQQDTAVLSAWLKAAPVQADPNRRVSADADQGDSLTPLERRVAVDCGQDPAKVARTPREAAR